MTTAIALDTDGLQRISGLPAKPALRQAANFLADLVKPDVLGSPGEFDSVNKVGGYLDDLEEASSWARRFSVRDPERWYQSTRSTNYELGRISSGSPLSRLGFAFFSLLARSSGEFQKNCVC